MSNPLLPNGSAVKTSARTRKLSPLGGRIYAALLARNWTQNALERTLFPDDKYQGRGRISRYMTGERGMRSLDPFLFERMADLLEVNFHWLVTGRGSMYQGEEYVFTPSPPPTEVK